MAPDLRFLAQGPAPEIGADRLIPRFAGLAALETFGIDIPAGMKEVEKESDPVCRRAGLGERRVRKCLGRDRTRDVRLNRGSALSENQERAALVRRHREAGGSRIRWRVFDGDGDSHLFDGEIAKLCEVLRSQPECMLFRCESERRPTSHPTYRARILLLSDPRGAEPRQRRPLGGLLATGSPKGSP